MIVTCPSCSRRYSIDDSFFAKGQRQVRCTGCANVWNQEYIEQAPQKNSLNISQQQALENYFKDLGAPSKNSKPYKKLSWAFYGLGVVCLFAWIFLSRETVALRFPILNDFGKVLSMNHTHDFSQINIQDIHFERTEKRSEKYIVISGEIQNNGKKTINIPKLQIIFYGSCADKNKKNCILFQQSFAVSEETLLPNERLSFETPAYPNVPNGTKGSLRF